MPARTHEHVHTHTHYCKRRTGFVFDGHEARKARDAFANQAMVQQVEKEEEEQAENDSDEEMDGEEDSDDDEEEEEEEEEEKKQKKQKKKKPKKKTKARLQELGPRFTLKLKWIQEGTFDTQFGEYEWFHKRKEMDTTRRKFHL